MRRTVPLLLVPLLVPLLLAGCTAAPPEPTVTPTTTAAPTAVPTTPRTTPAASPTPTATPTQTPSTTTPTTSPTPTILLPYVPPTPVAPTPGQFPAPLVDVGGVLWAGVSPMCGLLAAQTARANPNGYAGLNTMVGNPEAGYVCVGSDWTASTYDFTTDDPTTKRGPLYLWHSPENLMEVGISVDTTMSALDDAKAFVEAHRSKVTFADWPAVRADAQTVPDYPEIQIDTAIRPGVTTYFMLYMTSDRVYILYDFDDPAAPGVSHRQYLNRPITINTSRWVSIFRISTADDVLGTLLTMYWWRPGLDPGAEAGSEADPYADCRDPQFAKRLLCTAAYDPAQLALMSGA